MTAILYFMKPVNKVGPFSVLQRYRYKRTFTIKNLLRRMFTIIPRKITYGLRGVRGRLNEETLEK